MTIECALFLTQCLQSVETNRISADELLEHPFLQSETNELQKHVYVNTLTKVTEEYKEQHKIHNVQLANTLTFVQPNSFIFNTHTRLQTKALLKILRPDVEFTISDATRLDIIENFLDNDYGSTNDSLYNNSDTS